MKKIFLLLLLAVPAFASIDRVEVDARLISKTGNQMVVEIGKKRLTLPAARKIPTENKMKRGMIRVSVLPAELAPAKKP